MVKAVRVVVLRINHRPVTQRNKTFNIIDAAVILKLKQL